jgi:S1-C subfamily serine protease
LEPDPTSRDGWTDAALIGFLQEEVGDTEKALETYRAVRLMIRQEEMRQHQRAFSERRARIDLRLARLLNVRPPSLDIRQEDVDDELAQALSLPEARGIFVAEVIPGGSAQQAGLERGDVILSIDGNDVGTSWRGALDELHAPTVGDEVELLLIRDRLERTVRVQLGEKDLADLQNSSSFGDINTAFARLLDRVLYDTHVLGFADGELVVVDLRTDLRQAFEIPDEEDGVLVFSDWNAEMRLRSGDLIKEVEGQTVKDVAELKDAIAQLSEKGYSSVLIRRLTYGREETTPVMLRSH